MATTSGLTASASAPALPHARHATPGIAHTSSERVVPRLALVPLDQLQLQREQQQKLKQQQDRPHQRQRDAHGHGHGHDQQQQQKQQRRLGERFLCMLASLARLSRADLESTTVHLPSSSNSNASSKRSSALAQLVALKRARDRDREYVNGGTQHGELNAPRQRRPVVNAATAPLEEHLTWEISQLLPAPLDERQSALHSPLRRRTRQRQARRRKKKKKPLGAVIVDGRRVWQTSHACWTASVSHDLAEARRAEREVVERGADARTLADKLSALSRLKVGLSQRADGKSVVHEAGGSGEELGEEKEEEVVEEEVVVAAGGVGGRLEVKESNQVHASERFADAYSTDTIREEDEERWEKEREGEEDSSPEHVGGEEGEQDYLQEGDEEEEDTYPRDPPLDDEADVERERRHPPPQVTTSLKTGTAPPNAKAQQQQAHPHAAAWISPELKTWLLDTGLFPSRPRRTGSRPS